MGWLMSETPWIESLVRVLRSDGTAVGLGVLSYGQVLTAAHVVNAALEEPKNDRKSKRGSTVQIEFPLVAGAPLECVVERFQLGNRQKGGSGSPFSRHFRRDTATLRTQEGATLPGDGPWILTPADHGGHPPSTAKVYAFPAGVGEGVLLTCDIIGVLDQVGTIQLECPAGSPFKFEPGMSGAPVWVEFDDTTVCAGLLTHAGKDGRLALASVGIGARLSAPEPVRGSPLNLLAKFAGPVLSSFIADLADKEEPGLSHECCDQLKRKLNGLTATLSELDAPAFFPDLPLHKRFGVLSDRYERWNDQATTPSERRVEQRRLLEDRGLFTSAISGASRAALAQGDIDNVAPRLFVELREFLDEYTTDFPRTARVVASES
jgi:hypothetical protein